MVGRGTHAMKFTCFICLIFGLFNSVQSLDSIDKDRGFVETIKCCEFTNDNQSCVRMCEPSEALSTTETSFDSESTDYSNQKEVVEEEVFAKPATFSFAVNPSHICRKGFRLDSQGNCRKVFGSPVEKTTEQHK